MFLLGTAVGIVSAVIGMLIIGMLQAAKDYDEFDRYYGDGYK